MSTRLLFAAAFVSIAPPALPQAPAASAAPTQASAPATPPPAAYQASPASAPTLADQCLALLDGRAPANVDPVRLRPECESLLRAGASGQGQAALSGTGVQQGENVRAAYPQPPPPPLGGPRQGVQRSGGVSNTLTTNPIGWFSGLGVNAEYHRPLETDRFSYVIQGRYARAAASNGNVSTFGTGGGVDMYLLGGDNAGLRLGPRFTLAFGRESIQGTSTFARLGAAGELGYDYIASSGFTGSVAGGFGGRIFGDARNENFANFTAGETGPYFTLGLGYSW